MRLRVHRLWVRLVGSHVALVVVLAAMIGVLVLSTAQTVLRRAVAAGQREVAHRAAEEIHLFVSLPIARLRTLAVAMNVEREPWQRQSLLSQMGLQFEAMEEMCLIDSLGRIQATSVLDMNSPLQRGAELPPGYLADLTGMWRNLVRSAIHTSDIVLRNGRPSLLTAVPVWEDNRLTGALLARINLYAIWQKMDGIRIGETGRGVLLDQAGRIIAHPTRQLVYRQETHPQWQEILERRFGWFSRSDDDGVEWVAGFAHIEQFEWHVVVEQQAAEAFSLVLAMRRNVGLIVVCSVIGAAILGWILLRSIAQPVGLLTQAVRELQSGKSSVTALPVANDEIGELAAAFQAMSEALAARRRELESSLAFQGYLVHNSPIGLAVLNREMGVLQANKAWEEILGEAEGGPNLGGSPQGALLSARIRQNWGRSDSGRMQVTRGDGTVRLWQLNTVDLTDAYPDRALILLEDLTEQKAMELNMIQKDKLGSLGEMAAGIAHEMKNPLAIMQSAADLLRRLLPEETEERGEALERLESAIRRTNQQIHKLLDFARPAFEATEEVNVDDLLRQILDISAKYAGHSGISFDTSLAATATVVMNVLKDILLNVIRNAFEAMPEGGSLRAATWTDNGRVMTEISDTGVGMAPEVVKRIFDPFYTTKGSGTGLGLAIGYRQIKEAGGEITVASDIGAGTTFTLNLPATSSTAKPLPVVHEGD